MNEKIYLHTINNLYSDYYNPKRQKATLESILKSREVLSRRLQGNFSDFTNFAGLDYISLSDYEKRFVSNKEESHYNSYYSYVLKGLSLAFPHDSIKVIEPTIIGVCSRNRRDFEIMRNLGLIEDERFTDLPDEVQVKDRLSLENMNGLLFPVDNYLVHKVFTKKSKMIELMKQELSDIKHMLEDYGYNIDIYDASTLQLLDEEGIERKLTQN